VPPPRTRRDVQAAATRHEILSAARRLFAERGYARTSVRDVAATAGVSPQTVYDSVGSKRALVAGLNDLIDQEARLPELVGRAMAGSDPQALAALPARITHAIVGSCGDIVRTLVAGAAAEPDLARVLEEGQRRHRAGASGVAGKLAGLGALTEDLSVDQAAETLAALTDAQYALLLVDQHGWTLARVEEWMSDISRRLVLGETARPPE
jgi:AcrR family transcriptional regulator